MEHDAEQVTADDFANREAGGAEQHDGRAVADSPVEHEPDDPVRAVDDTLHGHVVLRDEKTRPRTRYGCAVVRVRSEEHTSELQSLMRNSYAVFCLKKKQ